MKNRELRSIADGLTELAKAGSAKLAYACIKNSKAIAEELKTLQESYALPESYKAYEKERLELCGTYSKKDENGNPMKKRLEDGSSAFDIENDTEFKEKIKALQEAHKACFQEYYDSMSNFESLMDQESTLELVRIKLSDIPDSYKKETVDESGNAKVTELPIGGIVEKVMPLIDQE